MCLMVKGNYVLHPRDKPAGSCFPIFELDDRYIGERGGAAQFTRLTYSGRGELYRITSYGCPGEKNEKPLIDLELRLDGRGRFKIRSRPDQRGYILERVPQARADRFAEETKSLLEASKQVSSRIMKPKQRYLEAVAVGA